MTPPDFDAAPGILVRASGVHGLGAFAARAFAPGERIARYEGRRIAPGAEEDWDASLTYLFGLSDGWMIDGSSGGNATRHLNHSCEPNCKAWEVEDAGGRLDVVIEALVAIRPGDELFIDYALEVDEREDPARFVCRCGSARCRGTMRALGAPAAPVEALATP